MGSDQLVYLHRFLSMRTFSASVAGGKVTGNEKVKRERSYENFLALPEEELERMIAEGKERLRVMEKRAEELRRMLREVESEIERKEELARRKEKEDEMKRIKEDEMRRRKQEEDEIKMRKQEEDEIKRRKQEELMRAKEMELRKGIKRRLLEREGTGSKQRKVQ